MASTIVVQTPLKYVCASLHTPVEVFVAVADTVFEGEKLTEGDLDIVTDEEAALEADTDADSDLEPEDEPEPVLDVVASIDSLADTLLLIVVLADSLLLIVLLAVSEAVKLGETGDFVTEGVGVGDGIIAVYDIKNTDPDPRLIIFAPIWEPPAL